MTEKIYNIDEIRSISKSIFSQYPNIIRAYLFGSYARNEQTKESDLDFMIVLNSYETKLKKKTYEVGVDLEDIFDKQVDIITEENAAKIMSKNMERDKVLVYERSN